ncbi:MAG: hypothetical protein BZ138_06135 [Methanosphaera sp. rholeuAM270]|nr:MAG: hypothetical protein BZ138_06135 [Methanosphaera sp. rholeuAM270]
MRKLALASMSMVVLSIIVFTLSGCIPAAMWSVASSGVIYKEDYGGYKTWVNDSYTLYIEPTDNSAPVYMKDSHWWNNDTTGLAQKIKEVKFLEFDNGNFANGPYAEVIAPANVSYMFSGLSGVEEIRASALDTSEVVDMSYMFSGCKNLERVSIGTWNTSQVKNMSSMFEGCENLKLLDLIEWKTSNVENADSMFKNCTSLTKIYIPSESTLSDVVRDAIQKDTDAEIMTPINK